jgi:DNA repair protein SbcC/Rad50
MRILRLKLTNLNSLRGEYEVNFETDPLANAGLFAITGPTGIGKSTLLDAITLALYGRAARYASISNPEDMMSRHCGECQAEVEFLVPSGRFRAEWQLRRARGKADGKLQTPKRYVYDANGQVLAEKIGDVEVLIEKLVGLDYQRFLRSVLLAQGEFARFLKANPNERAELLESLTGTIIYSQLSALAHRETTRRENELLKREAELGQVVLLTDEQRQDRERQIKDQAAKLTTQKSELSRLNSEVGQAKQLRTALSSETELLGKSGLLEKRKTEAAAHLSRLTQHRLTLPFAEDLNRLDAVIGTAQDQSKKLETAKQEQRRSHLLWITGIVGACDFASKLVEREEQALTKLQQTRKEQETQKQEAESWLAKNAPDKELEPQLPEIVVQISHLESLRRDLGKAKGKASSFAEQSPKQEKVIKNADDALVEAGRRLKDNEDKKSEATRTLEALLGGKTEAARESDLTRLRTQAQVMGTLVGLDESCKKQHKTIEDDRRKLKELEPKLDSAQAAAKEAAAKREAARKALALRQDQLQKAQLVASLEEHRAALKPGEPCPLCGAHEHPYADESKKAFSSDALQNQVKDAEEALTVTEETVRKAGELVTTIKTEQSTLTETIGGNEGELTAARNRISILAKQNGFEPGTKKTWIQAKAETDRLIERIQRELEDIRKAGRAVTDCETARLKAENAVETAKQAKENEEKRLVTLREQVTEQNGLVTDFEGKLTTTTGSLQKLLVNFGATPPDPGQEQLAREALGKRKVAYQTQAESLRNLASGLKETSSAVQSGATSVSSLRQKALPFAKAKAAHVADATAVEPSQQQALQSRWQNLEDAGNAVRTLETEVTKTDTAVTERRGLFDQSTGLVNQLGTELRTKLEGSPFTSIENLRAAKLSLKEATALEKIEQDLKSETDELKGRLEEVQKGIDELRVAKVAEGEAVALLELNLQAAQKANEELVTSIGSLRGELERDQQNRLNHAAKATEVEQERKRLQVWKQLQGLIGSHDGAKFRRYAQGISLDILIHHANKHLQRLSDRYRTRRRSGEELELEIEDLYQAGVTRPMASLSGGESFLASLALALGLADLAGRNVRIECLFIDEGFGSLDADTLDIAISALETLRQDNKLVGVISHVELLKERIATQVIVEKQSGGTSRIRVSQ